MLELRGVTRRYGGEHGVFGVDLVVPRQRTIALIGPSGCGKSTLLRLAVGLVWPDAGEVRVGGEPMRPETALALRRQLGYVIQDGGLFPHLSARDNAALMARWLGWDAARVRARIDVLAALVRLPAELLARHPSELSGGQKQRVALMRALMLDPTVLLLDEPMGALDPMVRAELQADLRSLFTTLGKTVVLVTHDLAEAAALADELVLLRAGRVVQRGTLRALVETPAEPFVGAFVRAQRGAFGVQE